MKSAIKGILFIILAVAALGCGQKPQETPGEPVAEESPNAVLERQVGDIHDEAMHKMGDIYKLQEKLKKMLTDSNIADSTKKNIQLRLVALDSADNLMRKWMHEFRPLNDSIDGEEKAREYLENEMVKVKELDAEMSEAIHKAGEIK